MAEPEPIKLSAASPTALALASPIGLHEHSELDQAGVAAGRLEHAQGEALRLAAHLELLTPEVGAVLMSASTVIVAINAQLLMRAAL